MGKTGKHIGSLLLSQRTWTMSADVSTVSYADFIVLGVLRGLFVVGGDKMLQQVTDREPAFLTLYDASKAWLERDDH